MRGQLGSTPGGLVSTPQLLPHDLARQSIACVLAGHSVAAAGASTRSPRSRVRSCHKLESLKAMLHRVGVGGHLVSVGIGCRWALGAVLHAVLHVTQLYC
jgi:hypothetical protein